MCHFSAILIVHAHQIGSVHIDQCIHNDQTVFQRAVFAEYFKNVPQNSVLFKLTEYGQVLFNA